MERHPASLLAILVAAALVLPGCGALPAGTKPQPGLRAAGAPAGASIRGGLRAAGVDEPGAEPEPPEGVALLPRFTRTRRGYTGDPVNVVIAGTERQVVEGFDQAGWLPADPVTLWNALRMLKAGITRGEYPTSPMSPLFLYDRVQDQCWQKNPRSIISRDHLRVWRSPLLDPLGRPYWVVAATKDIAVGWNRTRPTHRIDPDVDEERELVVDDWLATGQVARKSSYLATEPGYQGRNGGGDLYFTDGRVVVLELVPPPADEPVSAASPAPASPAPAVLAPGAPALRAPALEGPARLAPVLRAPAGPGALGPGTTGLDTAVPPIAG